MELKWYREGDKSNKKALILIHGFGANGKDLSGMGDYLVPQEYVTFYPEAPHRLFPGSFAWFPNKQNELNLASSGVLWKNLPSYDSDSIDEILNTLKSDIEELELDLSSLVIGGFSQGSMIALLLGLQLNVKNILLFSSSLVAENRLDSILESSKPSHIFMSHGKTDSVLDISGARLLRDKLENKHELTFFEFHGGHTIPNEALALAKSKLSL